jgi:ABC-type multidrug transport system fused ATPase/permease subunit
MKELGNLKKLEVIETLESIIRTNMFDISTNNNMARKLELIRHMLVHGGNLNERDISILESIVDICKQCKDHPEKKKELSSTLFFYINLFWQFRNRRIVDSEYNTEEYYKKTISELETKVKELSTSLNESKESKEQKDEIKKELEERKEQIKQIKAEKEELEKKLDAQKNIKDKITDAFKELKNHISHLEKEKRRLNRMFYIYAFLCVCVLVILVYFEFVYLSKWETPTKLIDYLPFYIPVPIVGGLLWAFIYQMNRAQRQLMLVAYELYHVDYVEGLLQAINMVSPNVTSASEKIGNVLDVMIKKHITTPNELFENSLDKEISKDNIDLKTFVNIAKEVKDVIK